VFYLRSRFTPIVTAGLALLAFLMSGTCNAFGEGTPLPSPSATATPAVDTKIRCCFCVVADPPADNAADQRKYCEQCLMNKSANPSVQSCDQLTTVLASKFKGPDPEVCTGEVLAYNLEHGPILQKSFERLTKCVAAAPTCNVRFMDLSCSSFGDADELKEEVEALQALLGPGQTVTVCGNVSDNYTKGCNDFISARKQLIITSTNIEDPVQECAKPSTFCAPPKLVHKCKAADGTIQRQRCCAKVEKVDGKERQARVGLWGKPGEYCSGAASCPPGCDKRAVCKDKFSSSFQECVKLEGGEFTCQVDEDHCGIGGSFCNPKPGKCEDPPTPAPSASPGPSGRAKSASPARAKSGRALTISQLDRSGRSFGIDRGLMDVASEPRYLLGRTTTATVSGAPGFRGILLKDLDLASTLALLRFKSGDVMHFVNDTPVVSVEDLSKALREAKTLTTITFSRGEYRWVLTLHIREDGGEASREPGGDQR